MNEPMSWKARRLNKGQFMAEVRANAILQVEHVDGAVDPYFAIVLKNRTFVFYTGLHPTLSSARQKCEEIVAAFN